MVNLHLITAQIHSNDNQTHQIVSQQSRMINTNNQIDYQTNQNSYGIQPPLRIYAIYIYICIYIYIYFKYVCMLIILTSHFILLSSEFVIMFMCY